MKGGRLHSSFVAWNLTFYGASPRFPYLARGTERTVPDDPNPTTVAASYIGSKEREGGTAPIESCSGINHVCLSAATLISASQKVAKIGKNFRLLLG